MARHRSCYRSWRIYSKVATRQTWHLLVNYVAVVLSNFHPNAPLPPYINPAAPPYEYGYPADEKAAFGPSRV
ncbi:hypothetical protein M408DRAFT_287605 [Serendipita vermifera MAFF 305830]|uniref:Uncharacterized protein n=1 Tax=Serendipita vermifera MAFF 305830 TaxID=933852 RepID=A0A0C3BEL7_SERVB|nr:hypothetical protein M408DRAFT_287605 [Serendipita vermifera MAFF 305830]